MKEQYLHFLWQNKRLPFNKLVLTDGSDLSVVETGWYNTDSGPDFFTGKVVIDHVVWSGNIELHVKSSDWYAHQHHHDAAYDNVILHVVLEHDKEVEVNGRVLPTLALKPWIDWEHYKRYLTLSNTAVTIACANFHPVPKRIVDQQVEQALFQRLNRKVDELLLFLGDAKEDRNTALFYLLATSLGGRANKLPFQELVSRVPVNVLLKERWDITRIEAILFGVAGMLHDVEDHSYVQLLKKEWSHLKYKHGLTEMQYNTWKYSGVRPPSFPSFKIAQLAMLIAVWNWQEDYQRELPALLSDLRKVLSIPVNDFWETHYSFKRKTKKHSLKMSKSAQNIVLINTVSIYLAYLGRISGKMHHIDCAVELLQSISAEKNYITAMFDFLSIQPKNAAESQGLIELKNEFCNLKRCLDCKIGEHVLNRG